MKSTRKMNCWVTICPKFKQHACLSFFLWYIRLAQSHQRLKEDDNQLFHCGSVAVLDILKSRSGGVCQPGCGISDGSRQMEKWRQLGCQNKLVVPKVIVAWLLSHCTWCCAVHTDTPSYLIMLKSRHAHCSLALPVWRSDCNRWTELQKHATVGPMVV